MPVFMPSSIRYHVYKNDGAGGPIDYSTIVATVTSPTYTPSAIPINSDISYAIRTYDSGTGLEEKNRDVVLRIVTDGSGHDISGRPSQPRSVTLKPLTGGGARVAWLHNPADAQPPTGFKVWIATGSISYGSAPAVIVPARRGRTAYYATLSGLSNGVTYHVAVRAYNAVSHDGNTVTADVVGETATAAPAAIEALTSETTNVL